MACKWNEGMVGMGMSEAYLLGSDGGGKGRASSNLEKHGEEQTRGERESLGKQQKIFFFSFAAPYRAKDKCSSTPSSSF